MQDDLIARCTTCGETNRALFCSNSFHGPQSVDARIAALEADNARLMGLVKVLQPYLVVLTEKPQKANWTDRYCAARDQLEVVASATLAKIKEATDAPVK